MHMIIKVMFRYGSEVYLQLCEGAIRTHTEGPWCSSFHSFGVYLRHSQILGFLGGGKREVFVGVSILAWDALEHDGLAVNDLPTPNIRRKKLYRQMALTINGGPMGKGVRIEHPRCVVDGIHAIAPDPDGKYMGHKEDWDRYSTVVVWSNISAKCYCHSRVH